MLRSYPINRSRKITDKFIVLDLDSTLIHSFTGNPNLNLLDNSELYYLRDRIYDLKIPLGSEYWGVARPGIYEFLQFCQRYFQGVIIWSAGTYDYVHAIVNFLFRDLPRPYMIFTRNDCTEIGNYLTKDLSKLEPIDPRLTMDKIYILDDNTQAFELNPENALNIPMFVPCGKKICRDILNSDDAFELVKSWFMQPGVINSFDVRELDKSKVFTPVAQFELDIDDPLYS